MDPIYIYCWYTKNGPVYFTRRKGKKHTYDGFYFAKAINSKYVWEPYIKTSALEPENLPYYAGVYELVAIIDENTEYEDMLQPALEKLKELHKKKTVQKDEKKAVQKETSADS